MLNLTNTSVDIESLVLVELGNWYLPHTQQVRFEEIVGSNQTLTCHVGLQYGARAMTTATTSRACAATRSFAKPQDTHLNTFASCSRLEFVIGLYL